jgi:5-methylcytosine-specific restriction protein A
MTLMRLCSICGARIPMGTTYCDICSKGIQERRAQSSQHYDIVQRKSKDNMKYNAFYHSKEWAMVRQMARARDHGLCIECLKDGDVTVYNVVHHIISIKENYNKKYELDNLVCLCEMHHQLAHKNNKK